MRLSATPFPALAALFAVILAAAAPAATAAGAASQADVAATDGTAIFLIADDPGEIHLSDRADAPAGVVVERIAGQASERPLQAPYAELVAAAARARGLDPALLHAVIAVESAYRPAAVSPRGAAGLMQLMPLTARHYGVTDVFDPRQNIEAGASHLRILLDHYRQDTARALAAYNGGTPGVAHPAAETLAYVPRVLARYAALRRSQGGASTLPADTPQ